MYDLYSRRDISISGFPLSGPLGDIWQKNDQLLRDEAVDQQAKGWLAAPSPIATSGAPLTLSGPSLDIACRFGVAQCGKLRACGGLRHFLTNMARVAPAPVRLFSRPARQDWRFPKADREDARNQLPLVGMRAKFPAIAGWRPAEGRLYGFFIRALMFGAISAVLRYNLFSMILADLANKLFGLSLIFFVGDFGDMIPIALASASLDAFALFCSKMGIPPRMKKSEFGREVALLGLRGPSLAPPMESGGASGARRPKIGMPKSEVSSILETPMPPRWRSSSGSLAAHQQPIRQACAGPDPSFVSGAWRG